MAIMIPDSCPSKATEGEKRVYFLIRATDHLAVTWTGRSTFTDRIAESKRAVARVHQE